MASRKPASRPASSMGPPQSTRSLSVASARAPSAAGQRSSQILPPNDLGDGQPVIQRFNPGSKLASAETNIKVVIRCRRRSEREIQDSSPIIVNSNGAKSNEVTIETAASTSTLGVVNLPPTRTYPFDVVFGPEADQSLVYQEVVAPMLEEVLQGYNCTLFAYGQTGTGKTHTMQGDLVPTQLGNPSAQAGMIPRVLFRLFHHLEQHVPDYSVKVSYIELYNEELRDLLAPELSAPSGSQQPMGKGGSQGETLKIFDDSGKKGVFIQGLEEVGVRTADEALAILTKGSNRRQIAATRFNDHSSRSHSVFTLTVHTKETSTAGEDLLRVGKMNLVDLAGSENIGRSGAADKRAREAGMINQSLLTLGRVINALVDGSSHIPYRESKLTRLLQDSLGGRTKTCIIATVSPARSNVEETLSTLDYALRAKSIRNKPELNQRMTRNALLKEYVVEIERLKADVLAAREKSGIYVSEVRWAELEMEQEQAQTAKTEALKQVDIKEGQLRSVTEELEQSIAVINKRERELTEARETLGQTEQSLAVTEANLKRKESALEQETIVRQAHEQTEAALDEVAAELRTVAAGGLNDLQSLFGKLDRKTAVFTSNLKSVTSHGKNLSQKVESLSTQLESFAASSAQHSRKLKGEIEHLQKTELDALSTLATQVNEQAHRTQEALGVVQAKEAVADDAMRVIEGVVESAFDNVRKGFAAWAETLQKTARVMCSDLQETSQTSFANVDKALKSVTMTCDSVVRDAQTYVEAERELASKARTAAEEAVASELSHLRSQNAHLTRLLDTERIKSERARDSLTQKIAGLVEDFAAERDRSIRDALAGVEQANTTAEAALSTFATGHGQMMDDALARGRQWSQTLDKKGSELKRTRDGALKVLTTSGTLVQDGLAGLAAHVGTSISSYSEEAQSQAEHLNSSYANALDRFTRSKRARVEATQAMATDSQAGYKNIQQNVASSSKLVSASTGKLAAENTEWSSSTDSYVKSASTQLGDLRHTTQTLLSEGTREDIPTGATPVKRPWQYQDRWERTKDRETLLRESRQQGHGALRRTLFQAPEVPILHDESEAEEAREEEEEEEEENVPDAPIVAVHADEEETPQSPLQEAELPPPPPPYEQVQQVRVDSKPITHSRTSSTASNSRAPVKRAASALPKGTLTERSSNVLANRRRLR